jgi:DNA topoisomerase I
MLNILIVESAAKARTLGRYLDSGWKVVATGGHVETLPNDRSAHGKDAKKAYWANRPGELPNPPWVWTDRGEAALEKILEHADSDAIFWIATDPDREGEFIAWCLERLLEPHARAIHRVTFQEVTEEAVRAALEHPRKIDAAMVDSALLRKFLDRLVGYRTSKLARSVIPGGSASMGRVQTPTLGFVVERELEREAHVPIPYFEVRARAESIDLQVRFHEPDDDDVWRNDAGRAIPTRTFDEEGAAAAEKAIRAAGRVEVTEVKRGRRTASPRAPFSTDALLQAAGSRFGWSPRKTSALASMLYEAGHVTYIRTDSERLAESAVVAARKVIEEAFGEDHLASGERPPAPSGPAGPVQDAHEAIRPTRLAEDEVGVDDADARRLYRLIRAHTLASLMAPSRYETARIETRVEGLERPITGSLSWRTFPGWEAAYAEFRDEPATSPPDATLEAGATWTLDPEEEGHPNPELVEDETQPPSRYRRHTLIRAMKDAGIGRPSTYSRTVEKLEERRYVEIEDNALVPTERGRAVWLQAAPLYTRGESKTELFSPEFTALMERRLDDVARSRGEADPTPKNGGGGVGADGVGETAAAAEIWEQWRDEIRELHDIARERKKAGSATPRTVEQLTRLIENVPEGMEPPEDPESLTEAEAREWIERLREAGVEPSPTERQMEYLANLMEALDMTSEEAAEVIGLANLDEIRASRQASALIEELAQLRDERRPPSPKQLGLIERLRKEAGLTEAEAAAMVDEPDLEGLTGGREGSASALIDRLLEETGKGKKGDDG